MCHLATMGYMDTLPNEILRKVMGNLDYCEMGRCMVVSKRWQSVLEDLLPPTTMVFSSTMLGAEHWGGLLGQYHLLPERQSEHPAYRQYSTGGGGEAYSLLVQWVVVGWLPTRLL